MLGPGDDDTHATVFEMRIALLVIERKCRAKARAK